MSGLSWTTILSSSFQSLWVSTIDFLPKLLGALIVLVLGILIANGVASLVRRLIKLLRVDSLISKLKVEQSLEHAGVKIVVGDIFAWIVKWFLLLVFFVTAMDILGWEEIVYFLNQVLLFLPSVAVAVAILLIGLIVSSFVGEVVKKVVLAAKMEGGDFLAAIAKYAILIFAIMAALIQLQVATQLIQILFAGIVVMCAIAGGLAFGLGGKEEAGKVLVSLSKNMKKISKKR
ncbi:hypothetical protein KJ885_01595 [Patescibacteria group bacterium]|nr:hypothetical protein [Patescibacteria group bacterium]